MAENQPQISETMTIPNFEIEPLTVGGILDRSFQICRMQFWKLLAIVSIPWLLGIALAFVIVIAAVAAGVTAYFAGNIPPLALIVVGVPVIIIFFIMWGLLFYISQGALIHAVSSIYLGRSVVVGDAYRFVLPKLGKFFWTSLLFVSGVFGLMIAAMIVGVLFFVLVRWLTDSGIWAGVATSFLGLALAVAISIPPIKWSLADKVVIIEDQAYASALRRSWQLMTGKIDGPWPRGYLTRWGLIFLLFLFINLGIALLFQAPATVVQIAAPKASLWVTIFAEAAKTIGSIVAGLFGSVCWVVFYYDIRNRKEGFDLRMLSNITEGTGRSTHS
jgi:hypothetical protein